MSVLNILLLVASLGLQLLLLSVLFLRRLASSLRLFGVLIGFYAVRSLLLVLLFRRVSPQEYVQILMWLSALDVCLQVAIAIEVALRLVRAGGRPQFVRALLAPAIVLLAAGLTAVLAALLPNHSRAPADRGSILMGFVFMGLFVWSRTVRLPRWPSRALAGFAGLGASGVVTQLGRSIAAIHRNAPAYRFWSYANAAVYLVVLVVWITQCRVDRGLAQSWGRVASADREGEGEITILSAP